MNKIEIYDPAMCCSTGVCGPGVDPELLRIATVVNNLQKLGKEIERFNLSENPQYFLENPQVNKIIQEEGVEALPLTLLNNQVIKKGAYPSTAEMMDWSQTKEEELLSLLIQERMMQGGCSCGGSC